MRSWLRAHIEEVFDHRLFRLERHTLRAGEAQREAMVLKAPDWVNVIPLLPDGRVLFVRQWRFGLEAPTLEVPGGMVDPGETMEQAALRELFEETGYRAAKIENLGDVHPNPAFISNRCGSFLATELEHIGDPQGDGEEELSVEAIPLDDVPSRIARGEITHALVVAAFYRLGVRGLR